MSAAQVAMPLVRRAARRAADRRASGPRRWSAAHGRRRPPRRSGAPAASLVQRSAAAGGGAAAASGCGGGRSSRAGSCPRRSRRRLSELADRCVILHAAHVVLFCLLAAATWVDLRHRVIPDAITVPGVLAGLARGARRGPTGSCPVAARGAQLVRAAAAASRRARARAVACGSRVARLARVRARPRAAGSSRPPASSRCGGSWARSRGRGRVAWPAHGGRAASSGRGASSPVAGGGDRRCGLAGRRRPLAGTRVVAGGLAVSAGIVWLTRAGASRALGREAMGLGDVTLMAMVGAWLGWQAVRARLLPGVFIGLAHGIVQFVLRQRDGTAVRPEPVPGVRRPWWSAGGRSGTDGGASSSSRTRWPLVVAAVIVLTAVTLWAWRRIRADFRPGDRLRPVGGGLAPPAPAPYDPARRPGPEPACLAVTCPADSPPRHRHAGRRWSLAGCAQQSVSQARPWRP